MKYWKKRFSGLKMSEDIQIRSIFKELSEAEMIKTAWAENVPFLITVLNNGISYFSLKNQFEKKAKRFSRREWIIAITSALIGAVIGLIPYIFF